MDMMARTICPASWKQVTSPSMNQRYGEDRWIMKYTLILFHTSTHTHTHTHEPLPLAGHQVSLDSEAERHRCEQGEHTTTE